MINKPTLVATLLGLLTAATLALPHPIGQDKVHVVGAEDTIYTVSRQYGLAPDHILWANNLSLKRLPEEGDELVIPLRRIPPFTPSESTAIVLNLPERMLYLFRGGRVVKFWGVAIGGIQYPTPSGTFRILDKEKDPTWEPPAWLEREAVGPGPDNPLGDRWMQITPRMVGIHGTNNPDSIGGVASLGCIRLYPESIRELYEQVSVGTPVYSVYEQVRIAEERDGTVVWSCFPDPYSKYYSSFQAKDRIDEARAEGFDLEISDFEISERLNTRDGLIYPVYGMPITVKSDVEFQGPAALKKPTGNWLSEEFLEKSGFEVISSGGVTTIKSPDGKTAQIAHEKVPLNPHRLPRFIEDGALKLEGHRWKGKTWLPFPLVLDYFDIPYEWDKRKSVLNLEKVKKTVSHEDETE